MTTDNEASTVGISRSEMDQQHPSPDGPGDQWAELERALRLIAEGYPVTAKDDRYILIENPDYRPDNSSDPFVLIDVSLIAAARAAPTGEANSKGSSLRDTHRAAEVTADHPETDGTDAAHPAWWRAHEHTAAVFCQMANRCLDGEDPGKGICNEPWETLRQRLRSLALAPAPSVNTELLEAVGKLIFMARTSGGTAGPDRDLMAACKVAEQALSRAQPNNREGGK